MNKVIGNFYSKLIVVGACIISAVTAHAQVAKSIYDIDGQKPAHSLANGPLPGILFGALFVVGIYVIYHYWANGKLKDDMS